MFAVIALATAAASPAPPPRPLLGAGIAVREWRVAHNRAVCAPLGLAGNGGVRARARRADFGAGWGVAFDSPRRRSAYGFAGSGTLPDDSLSHSEKRAALAKQWPYQRELGRVGGLPRGSFAGYGLQGAVRYSRRNPQGLRQYSLAYVRIPGQACLYNVWSRVSRRHLERLLDSLRFAPAPPLETLSPLQPRP